MQRLDVLIAFVVVMLGVSLIITLCTQIVSSFLGYRGTNLRWGLVQLLKTLDPSLEGHAELIAQTVLTHPLISDSNVARFARQFVGVPLLGPYLGRLHLASAIRVEELLGILQQLSDPKANAGTAGSAVTTLLAKVDPAAAVMVPRLANAIGSLIPAGSQGASQLVNEIIAAEHSAVGSVESWFNTAMDRVKQRFAMQMRIWTILLAIALVFGMHLDAIRIFNQLSSNPEATQKLVDSAQALEKAAEQTKQQPQNSADVQEAAKELKEVSNTFNAADFQLIPNPYPPNYSGDNWLGLAFAAALLSLGAPFWFNALKALCSLRPMPTANQLGDSSQSGS